MNSNDDVIDQRDVQRHFEELAAEQNDLQEELKDAETALAFAQLNGEIGTPLEEAVEAVEEAKQKLADWNSDYEEEMNEVRRVADEVPDSETMVNESYGIYIDDSR